MLKISLNWLLKPKSPHKILDIGGCDSKLIFDIWMSFFPNFLKQVQPFLNCPHFLNAKVQLLSISKPEWRFSKISNSTLIPVTEVKWLLYQFSICIKSTTYTTTIYQCLYCLLWMIIIWLRKKVKAFFFPNFGIGYVSCDFNNTHITTLITCNNKSWAFLATKTVMYLSLYYDPDPPSSSDTPNLPRETGLWPQTADCVAMGYQQLGISYILISQ